MQNAIRYTDFQSDNRLGELGLKVEHLMGVVKDGYIARSSATKNDAPMWPGLLQYNFTLRRLREVLAPLGWTNSDEKNYSRTISPDGKTAIVICSGNVHTGTAHTPSNRNPRGQNTIDVVDLNVKQLTLDIARNGLKLQDDERPVTWLLLYYYDKKEIRSELSLPSAIKDGYIIGWSERIHIPSQPAGSGINIDPDYGPDIDVSVTKKT